MGLHQGVIANMSWGQPLQCSTLGSACGKRALAQAYNLERLSEVSRSAMLLVASSDFSTLPWEHLQYENAKSLQWSEETMDSYSLLLVVSWTLRYTSKARLIPPNNARTYKAAAFKICSAPLQNHSRSGSIDSNEHCLGTWSSGGILGAIPNLGWWLACCYASCLGVSPAKSGLSCWGSEMPLPHARLPRGAPVNPVVNQG